MNLQTANRATAAAIGFILVSGIFAVVTVAVKLNVPVPAVDADPAVARTRALAEIRALEEKSLATPAWLDQSRGLVRLPIETAMQLAAQPGLDAAAARAGLKARLEKSVAPVAAKPSAFE